MLTVAMPLVALASLRRGRLHRASHFLTVFSLAACTQSPVLTRFDLTPRLARAPAELQLYHKAPERPHTVIALWDVRGSSEDASALRTAALAQAAALGADAAIITVNEQLMIMCLPSGYVFVCGEGDIPIYTNQTDLKARFIVWR